MKLKNQTWLSLALLIGLMTIGVLFLQQDAFAKSKPKVKTITITKINQKTAKQVHKQLMRGKKFKLRVKGNAKSFHKKAEKLMDKVALCTEYRCDFYPIILSEMSTSKVGGYTYYTVSQQNCQEYIYGIKFAKRRRELFISYLDKTIPMLKNIRNRVANNDPGRQIQLIGRSLPIGNVTKEAIPKENIPTEIDRLIASTRELSKYLHKTKFYKLSEAMRARIMLPVSSNIWCKPAMRYTLDKDRASFKALYQNKACGWCSTFASVTCKTCAMFNIGDCDYFSSTSENHGVARAKLKTLGGKTKYSVISNGNLENYNDYTGYRSISSAYITYRGPHKKDKKIKKIDAEQRELRVPFMRIGMRESGSTKKPEYTYCVDLPRSEW